VLAGPGGTGAVPGGAAWLPGDVVGEALGEPVRGTPGVVDGGHGMPVVTPAPATLPVLDGSPDVELGAEGLPGRQFGSRPEPGVDGEIPLVPVCAAAGRAERRRPMATAVVLTFIVSSLIRVGRQQRRCQRHTDVQSGMEMTRLPHG
jgi:hypothetical protein